MPLVRLVKRGKHTSSVLHVLATAAQKDVSKEKDTAQGGLNKLEKEIEVEAGLSCEKRGGGRLVTHDVSM